MGGTKFLNEPGGFKRAHADAPAHATRLGRWLGGLFYFGILLAVVLGTPNRAPLRSMKWAISSVSIVVLLGVAAPRLERAKAPNSQGRHPRRVARPTDRPPRASPLWDREVDG